MARIPKALDENLNPVNVLNAVRNDIGGSYARDVPEMTAYDPQDSVSTARALERLHQIGDIIMNYQSYTNSFLDQLVNRIAYVLISSRLYRNPWASLKRGYMELGETVEELFVNLTNAHQYDPETAETQVFRRQIPDVRAAFHTMNYQKFYKVTIQRAELRQAFLTFSGLNNLVSKILETLASSANLDEFLMMKYIIAKWALNGQFYVETVPDATLQNADQIAAQLRELALDAQYMSDKYNYAGVMTYSDLSSQELIMTNKFTATIDVGALAVAYNMDKADFLSRTIGVNNFTFTDGELERLSNLINLNSASPVFTSSELQTLSTIQAILVDKDWFYIFDNEDYMEAQRNGEGMYFNHWYHVWKTFSASPFNTAILLTTATPSITSVAVTPATATIAKGSAGKFTATVTGSDLMDKAVVWSVNSDVSTIDSNGVLTVAASETETSLTVTATSVADSTKSGTSTVTVS